jgi:epoxyqueuosine reductase
VNDLCGGCNKCIEACPTDAIVGPRVLDARKCISYLTIEYKGELPRSEKEKFQDWIFGCDICQEVCPWNRKVRPHQVEAFQRSKELKSMDKQKWEELTLQQFQMMFKGSAVKRAKFEGLKRNIRFVSDEG